MTEKIEHRTIYPGQCPRCGGFNTSSAGRDGTPTETFVCHDCTKVNEDLDSYDVVRSEAIESVNWTDADEEYRTVYDTEYLARQEAQGLLEELDWIVQFIEEHPEWDDNYFRECGEAHAETDWFERAKARVAAAKGEQP